MERDLFTTKPDEIDPERFVIATYYVESELGTHEAGRRIAIEESIGTWTELTYVPDWVQKRLPAKVFRWEEGNEGRVDIAYPIELFDVETGGIPQILSVIAGNLFGLSALHNVRLVDVEFPREIVKAFPGPKIGIQKLRKISGTTETRRAHLGTILKPKVGLDPDETAKVAYEAGMGGCDLIKDDETLINQKFCPIEERSSKTLEALDRVREETGHTVLYAINITSSFDKMLEMADKLIEIGANMLMIDVLTAGFSAVQLLAKDPSINLPLHIHRTMHAAITRNPKHGIDMMVLAKLVRLAGGDQLHTGTAAGKMERDVFQIRKVNDFLRGSWHNFKTVFPVASGGIHPGIVPVNINSLGRDLVIQAGGGIHGHPMGTRSGATAMRQAIEATLQNVPLEKYAKTRKELLLALQKWGYKYSFED